MTPRRPIALFPTLVLLALLCAMIPAAGAQQNADKIEPRLRDQLAAEGRADFVVTFAEQPDLAPAYALGWAARGDFVYNTLQETAARSQAGAGADLDARGLRHQTLLAANALYVWAGDLEAAEALAGRPEVGIVRAARTSYVDPILAAAPAAPDALAWGLGDAKADQFWAAFGLQGDGIVVANIDTGVQWNHPALDQSFKCGGNPANPLCWSDPSNICGGTACDNNGHGSHTMGTMVGDDDPGLTYQVGMAPNAQWIACKGCESTSCSEFALSTCADWILSPGGSTADRPHVVNNSWGGGGCDTWFQSLVQAWQAAGIFPAFSAGNSGSACSTMGSPGDYQESFASAAHDASRNAASFSSRGPSCFGHDPYTKPNISAPGVSICSTVPTNAWSCGYSGTSMASPHSAGAVALLWSCSPGLIGQIDATFLLLQGTADAAPAGNCGAPPDGEGNYTYGYGYLNVLAAGQDVCLQTGTLAGHVYDDSSNPLAGATVTADPGGAATTTNIDGLYSMPLEAGTYNATAAMPGFQSQTLPVTIVAGETTVQDFYLPAEGLWTLGPDVCFDLTRLDAEYYPATGLVYVLGGRTGTDTVGDIYAFDPAAQTCVDTGADMPTPISNYTANLVNDGSYDLLCTFGGRRADGTNTLDVQCYNPLTNAAAVVAQLPAGYDTYVPGAQAVVANEVLIFGGFRNTAAPYELGLTYGYDPVGHAFQLYSNMTLPRSYLFAGVVGNAIYAFGGTIFDGTSLVAQTRAEVLRAPYGWWYWYDGEVADLPVASAEGQAFSSADYIYPGYAGKVVLAGGGQWPNETAEALIYDTVADSYDYGFPNLNVGRRNQAGVLVPLCTTDPADGLPGLWVVGGRCSASGCGGDSPPYAPAEYLPLPCTQPVPVCQPFSRDRAASLPIDGPHPFGDDPARGHWGSTDLQALNLAFDVQPLTASFLDPSGELRETIDFTLPGGGTGVYAPGGLPLDFSGTLLLETPVRAAMAVVHLEEAPEDGGNAIFPGVADETVGHQAYTPVDGCTALHIHNLDQSATANVTVLLYDLYGTPVATIPGEVPPRGTWPLNLRALPSLPADFAGGAVVAADQLIQVTTQGQCQGYYAFGAAAYCDYEFWAPYAPPSLYGQMTTTLWLQNPTDEPAMAVVTYTAGFSGAVMYSLPPWSTARAVNDATEEGLAQVTSDVPLLVTLETDSSIPGSRGTAGYRVPGQAEATRAVALPVLFAGDYGWETGDRIWVLNVGDALTHVKIRFSNNADDSLAWAEQDILPGEVWRTALPPMPGTRAAAIVLADPAQPILAVAGAGNADPDLRDAQLLYAGSNFPLSYQLVNGPALDYALAGMTVHFTATADGTAPIEYLWDFGDGSRGAGQTVSHTYAGNDAYTVVLTATNVWEYGAAVTSQVVNLTCDAVQIEDVTTAIVDCAVTFTADLTGTAPFSYYWDFGAFGYRLTPNPTLDFGQSGTYPYTVTVSNCSTAQDTWSGAVTVSCVPHPVTWRAYLPVVIRGYAGD